MMLNKPYGIMCLEEARLCSSTSLWTMGCVVLSIIEHVHLFVNYFVALFYLFLCDALHACGRVNSLFGGMEPSRGEIAHTPKKTHFLKVQ